MNTTTKLPDFLMIGAAKAGTTAMFRALSRHPQIYCSPIKEPQFFAYAGQAPRFPCPGGMAYAARIVTNETDYRGLFAGCPQGAIAGEASNSYLESPTAPATAFHHVPHARLVAILRHPVARAYSQWLHHRQEGIEDLADFEAAWNAGDERAAKGYRPSWLYRHRGFYGRYLHRWLEFFPREQVLIVFYEDWLQHPSETFASVLQHLGAAPLSNPVITQENRSSRQPRWPWLHHRMVENNVLRRWAQSRLPLSVRDAITGLVTSMNLRRGPPLDSALRARLAIDYHEDLRQVEALTQRDLSAWRS